MAVSLWACPAFEYRQKNLAGCYSTTKPRVLYTALAENRTRVCTVQRVESEGIDPPTSRMLSERSAM